jgi:hypothetical protein
MTAVMMLMVRISMMNVGKPRKIWESTLIVMIMRKAFVGVLL